MAMANTQVVRFEGNGGSFELAVNPKELGVTQGSGNKTINLLNVGEVVIAGNRGPVKMSVATFLPAANSHFYRDKDPEEIITKVKQWKNGKQPLRIIVSGTDINTMFLVDSMEERYKEAQLDIYIHWRFAEYRVLNVPASATTAFTGNINSGILKTRSGTAEIPKKVTVKKGDSLWGFAVRFYGDGSLWKKIADANGIANPDRVAVGTVLEIPRIWK